MISYGLAQHCGPSQIPHNVPNKRKIRAPRKKQKSSTSNSPEPWHRMKLYTHENSWVATLQSCRWDVPSKSEKIDLSLQPGWTHHQFWEIDRWDKPARLSPLTPVTREPVEWRQPPVCENHLPLGKFAGRVSTGPHPQNLSKMEVSIPGCLGLRYLSLQSFHPLASPLCGLAGRAWSSGVAPATGRPPRLKGSVKTWGRLDLSR